MPKRPTTPLKASGTRRRRAAEEKTTLAIPSHAATAGPAIQEQERAKGAKPVLKSEVPSAPPWLFLFLALLAFGGAWYGKQLLERKSVPTPPPLPVQPNAQSRPNIADYVPELPDPSQIVTTADVPKRDAVAAAFKSAWHAYEADAFGADEYHPLSHGGSNLSADGGIGYMIIDALDTIYMMGLEEEYARARTWVQNELSFERSGNVNVFEVTIRVLGGLLSTYAMTSDPLYLDKAVLLADALMPAFSTPSGIPTTSIDLLTQTPIRDKDNKGLSGTAEATTLQLELKYLSHVTGDEEYWRKAENVMGVVRKALKATIVPIFISPDTGEFFVSQVRLGSRGDSYYEYLLKQWLQTNRTEHVYRQMWDDATASIDQFLIQRSPRRNLTYTAELHPLKGKDGGIDWRLTPKQDHLACFLGGCLMLGVTEGAAAPVPYDGAGFSRADLVNWRNGAELIKTCMDTHNTPTGLAPEIAMFWPPSNARSQMEDWYVKRGKDGTGILDGRYILRPETIESLFLAFRLTGDPKYREWGWKIFQAIEKHCRTANGAYAAVADVQHVPSIQEDKMETFMMSETLKYLWLLFSDTSVFPLDQWVFNTEAHPLPIFTPTIRSHVV